MTRVPVPVLVASAVLGLLTGVTAVVVATAGDEPPPARSTPTGVESHTVRLAFEDEDALLEALMRPLALDDPPDMRGYGAACDAGYLVAIGRRPA